MGKNNKNRFEINRDISFIRCTQGHSVWSGVRPDCLPVVTNLEYVAHGESQEAVQSIARDGLSRCARLRVHFYECGRHGRLLGNESIRSGPGALVVVSAHQCIEDGMVFYRSSNNVILTVGFGGFVEPHYFRFALRLSRNPSFDRTVIWGPSQSSSRVHEPMSDIQPETMFTQTNPDAMVEDDNALPSPSNTDDESTQWPDEPLDSPNLDPVEEGGGPFSDCSSDYAPGRVTDDQSCSSVVTRTAVNDEVQKEPLMPPHPSFRIALLGKMEAEPLFATHHRTRVSRRSLERQYDNHLGPIPPKIEEVEEEEEEVALTGAIEESVHSLLCPGGVYMGVYIQGHQKVPLNHPLGRNLSPNHGTKNRRSISANTARSCVVHVTGERIGMRRISPNYVRKNLRQLLATMSGQGHQPHVCRRGLSFQPPSRLPTVPR